MSDDERAARYSDLFGAHHEHTSDCAYCPICTAIAAVRKTNPEVLDHLASAARELMIAAGMFLEEAGHLVGKPQPADGEEDGAGKVRRIDVV
ncbi:MAG TPA: hypothetical protein VFK89_07740 [Actinomycetota bacterium]|nr:hypothetical protein [Actinomycetota bacterium]